VKPPNDYFPYAAAALSGLVVCLAISITTGRREAWDSGVYFAIGIPLMCVLIAAISYLFPIRAWRWTLSMAVGQSAAIALGDGSFSLWPLSIIAMTVLSLPQLAVGSLASRLAKRTRSV
jgi:hypothetical protein